MKSIQVVLVEDQLLILNSLKIILNATEDIEVVGTAMNGEEALSVLEQVQPDVVLMDVHMPIMDGLEATRLAKAKWPSLKIIMLTTLQTRDSVVGALEAGAEGYILKAIDPLDLAAAIRLVSRGETMISQEVAKLLFTGPKGGHLQPANEREALTEREMEILKCLSNGLTNSMIAEKLFLSEGTVRNYISSIYSKLNVHSRIEAINKTKGLF
ncbi:response regulator transcription factor [Paenibacillus sp. 3LSP]|uniref:response regulator transcription factor n=1 Tax=Paenibacillus sp. 3LSP TaxID=2800795 RepID=UPI0028FDAFB7|nr:response regulator transcription factor [Paenibacillus sp. 3LSP]MDU0331250.1 response regulator transcription factor [Paenibacillus sp. 3LSP]